jgi:hypothetical protein
MAKEKGKEMVRVTDSVKDSATVRSMSLVRLMVMGSETVKTTVTRMHWVKVISRLKMMERPMLKAIPMGTVKERAMDSGLVKERVKVMVILMMYM